MPGKLWGKKPRKGINSLTKFVHIISTLSALVINDIVYIFFPSKSLKLGITLTTFHVLSGHIGLVATVSDSVELYLFWEPLYIPFYFSWKVNW